MSTKINISALKSTTVLASTLSQLAYNNVPPLTVGEFKRVTVLADNFTATTPNNEFSATTYVNVTTGQVVIAYRGSTSFGIATESARIATVGEWSPQLTDATNYAAKAKVAALAMINAERQVNQQPLTQANDVPILVTGHSLGGMLAQVVSKMFGYPAETFDGLGGKKLVYSDTIDPATGKPAFNAGFDARIVRAEPRKRWDVQDGRLLVAQCINLSRPQALQKLRRRHDLRAAKSVHVEQVTVT